MNIYPKAFIFLISFILIFKYSYSQEHNIFYADPHEMKEFLGKDFKKIEIEIVKYRGMGPDKTRMPGKSAYRIIEFDGTMGYRIINKTREDESDTTFYTFDNCGKLLLKKGPGVHSKYSNRYKICKLQSREANETEVDPGGYSHQWTLIRYLYDKAGRLDEELIYDFNDTNIIKFSSQYTYRGNFKDSVKEYYYDEDGVKLVNRLTKYYHSSKLDSIHYYNSEFFLIDKTEYAYHPSGKVKTIIAAGVGTWHYAYDAANRPNLITEEPANKEYVVRYFD